MEEMLDNQSLSDFGYKFEEWFKAGIFTQNHIDALDD
jgi:hypothetical protein